MQECVCERVNVIGCVHIHVDVCAGVCLDLDIPSGLLEDDWTLGQNA